jgi:hypothetical protein
MRGQPNNHGNRGFPHQPQPVAVPVIKIDPAKFPLAKLEELDQLTDADQRRTFVGNVIYHPIEAAYG